MTCPACGVTGEPAATVGEIQICDACGASCVGDRRATAKDTVTLSQDALTALRKARGRAKRRVQ